MAALVFRDVYHLFSFAKGTETTMKRAAALALGPLVLLLVPFVSAQTPETPSSAGLWDVLVAPSMDPEKSAVAENVDKYKLVATGQKASESLDGKELVTTWKVRCH
jgi:hypothetical protein